MIYTALIAIQVLFGINFVAMKIVVTALPPLLWAAARILCAALIMVATCLAMKRKHPKPELKFFGSALVFALLAITISQGAVSIGLRYTTATNSAILNTLIPIVTLLIVTLRGQEPLLKRRVWGFFFAFAGVLFMKKVEQMSLSNSTLKGDLLILLNVLTTSLFLTYGKKFTQSYDRLWTTAYLFIFGGLALAGLAVPGLVLGSGFQAPPWTPELLGAMGFVIIGGTLLPYFLNVWALAQAPSSSVAIFVYVQPLIAAALGYFMTGEVPSLRTLAASLIIFAGVVLVVRN